MNNKDNGERVKVRVEKRAPKAPIQSDESEDPALKSDRGLGRPVCGEDRGFEPRKIV